MEHMTKAVTVTEITDRGEFSAIAAAYSVDRQNEQIRPGAFRDTIARWRASGKAVPVHWDHRAGAESVIGSVDPASMRERNDGLYVEGQLDIEDSELAREAWRSVKRNRISLSFGYLVTDSVDRADGVKELRALDVFEITLTPTPANSDTRVLSAKSVTDGSGQMVEIVGRDGRPELVPAGVTPWWEVDEIVRGIREREALAAAKKAQPIQIAVFEC